MREHEFTVDLPHSAPRLWALFQRYDLWKEYAPAVLDVEIVYPGDLEGNGLLLFAAILLHKAPEGFAIASVVLAARGTRRQAILAASAVGLDVAGVDLLESNEGPKVVELNSSPGFEGLEQATGLDIAGEIVGYAAQVAEGAKRVVAL